MTWRRGFTIGLLALTALAPRADAQLPAPRGLVVRGDEAVPGFTLLAPLRSTSTYLVDLDGEVAHVWQDDLQPGFAVYLLPGGRLLRVCRWRSPGFQGSAQGGLLREFDWDGQKTWEFGFGDGRLHLHHDVEPLPNGNVLVIAWELLSAHEALDAGRDPELVPDLGFWPCTVLEVRPTRPLGGEIVWRWRAWDHLIQDRDETRGNYGKVAEHPERLDLHADARARAAGPEAGDPADERALERQLVQLGYVGTSDSDGPRALDQRAGRAGSPGAAGAARADWLHVNAVDYLPEHDLIVLSSRHLSEVFVIDHSTTTAEAASGSGGRFGRGGDLLYRWGNPQNHGGGTAREQVFFGQHDVRWCAADGGGLTLSVFNNGVPRRRSSVEVIQLPFDASTGFRRDPGGALLAARVLWSWSSVKPESLFSSALSGAQLLEGGHVLVCSGTEGRILEVAASGEIVWEFENDLGLPGPGDDAWRGTRAAIADVPPPPGVWDRRRSGAWHPNVSALFRATRVPADDPRLARLDVRTTPPPSTASSRPGLRPAPR